MSEVGVLLRKIRLDAGMTQQELAERLDLSPQYISDVERGKSVPSWHYIRNFANALNANVVTLLRAAGLIAPDTVELEQEIAAMVTAYPDLAAVFEYARRTGERGLLEDLARQARLLILEKEQEEREQREE